MPQTLTEEQAAKEILEEGGRQSVPTTTELGGPTPGEMAQAAENLAGLAPPAEPIGPVSAAAQRAAHQMAIAKGLIPPDPQQPQPGEEIQPDDEIGIVDYQTSAPGAPGSAGVASSLSLGFRGAPRVGDYGLGESVQIMKSAAEAIPGASQEAAQEIGRAASLRELKLEEARLWGEHKADMQFAEEQAANESLLKLQQDHAAAEAARNEKLQQVEGELQAIQDETIDGMGWFKNSDGSTDAGRVFITALVAILSPFLKGARTGMNMIMKAIDNDVDAQKFKVKNKTNALNNKIAIMTKRFGNERVAEEAVRLQALEAAKKAIMRVGARYDNPIMKANAEAAQAEFDIQIAQAKEKTVRTYAEETGKLYERIGKHQQMQHDNALKDKMMQVKAQQSFLENLKVKPGDKLPERAIEMAASYNSTLKNLNVLKDKWQKTAGWINRVGGSVIPFVETHAKVFDAELKPFIADLLRSMSGAATTNEEREWYMSMMPSQTDSNEMAMTKLATMYRTIQTKQGGLMNAYRAAGYDVSPFGQHAGGIRTSEPGSK